LKNYRSFEKLELEVRQAIQRSDLDLGLRVINGFVGRVVSEPLCTAQIFGSRSLDRLCQEIGNQALQTLDPSPPDLDQRADFLPITVYIVSKVQESGGHSRVIADFIRSSPPSRHFVLSTEVDGKSNDKYFMATLSGDGTSVHFESAPGGSFGEKLVWLLTRLLALKPAMVYLFNHHQDSVAVAAMQPNMGFQRRFFHHGDHHLCLGVYLDGVEHFDAHPMGYHYCRDVLKLDNFYVPLSLRDFGDRATTSQFLSTEKLVTCTAARSNKVEIPYPFNYIEMIPRVLAATGGKHIHIGRLSVFALLKIRRELRRNSVPSGKFVYIPFVPSVWKALHEHSVDLYIASFPYGGGLTLIEAMGAGVPVALHRHIQSSFLSCIELGYPDALSWASPDELIAYCRSLSRDQLSYGGMQARAQYLKFHRPEVLVRILRVGLSECPPAPLPQSSFFPNTDEWARWLIHQVSLTNVATRLIYRALKRVRARISMFGL
jgi:hypothetical protein